MKEELVDDKIVIDDSIDDYMYRRYVLDTNSDIEKVWEKEWKDTITKDGKVDLLAVKRELCDYYHLLNYSCNLNSFVTNGRLKKALYPLPVILNEIGRQINKMIAIGVAEEMKHRNLSFKLNKDYGSKFHDDV